MLVRRRKVRIEIEQQMVRMEVTAGLSAGPNPGTDTGSMVEPTEATPLQGASGTAKNLKSGEAL